MWEALWDAAERGVRVRVLLDDANTGGLDPTLAALDAHPNIEVRLFNPFANRGFRVGDFAFDFSRVNRRMHNKSFTADNQVTIVGGRNIGDEYFGANMEVGFQDLDVLAVGPVVREVSTEFDLFWNSASAYPAASLLAPPAPGRRGASCRPAGTQVARRPAGPALRRRRAPDAAAAQTRRRPLDVRMDDRARDPRRPGQGARADRPQRPADAAAAARRHSASRSANSTWSRPTSCRARTAPKALVTLARAASRCAC